MSADRGLALGIITAALRDFANDLLDPSSIVGEDDAPDVAVVILTELAEAGVEFEPVVVADEEEALARLDAVAYNRRRYLGLDPRL
jgi:hypothetical protein